MKVVGLEVAFTPCLRDSASADPPADTRNEMTPHTLATVLRCSKQVFDAGRGRVGAGKAGVLETNSSNLGGKRQLELWGSSALTKTDLRKRFISPPVHNVVC
jgi:hypothetical protein